MNLRCVRIRIRRHKKVQQRNNGQRWFGIQNDEDRKKTDIVSSWFIMSISQCVPKLTLGLCLSQFLTLKPETNVPVVTVPVGRQNAFATFLTWNWVPKGFGNGTTTRRKACLLKDWLYHTVSFCDHKFLEGSEYFTSLCNLNHCISFSSLRGYD